MSAMADFIKQAARRIRAGAGSAMDHRVVGYHTTGQGWTQHEFDAAFKDWHAGQVPGGHRVAANQSLVPVSNPAAGSAANQMAGSYSINPEKGYLGNMGGNMMHNLTSKFGDGWGIAKAAGMHALKGAVGGAAIEGTQNYAQGGSFWEGAKAGAWDGAVGWSAYRMAGHAFGATSRNPFSRNGALGSAMDMSGKVSKQVKAIARARGPAQVARGMMNQ